MPVAATHLPVRCLGTKKLICDVPVPSASGEVEFSTLRYSVHCARLALENDSTQEIPPFGYTLWLQLKIASRSERSGGQQESEDLLERHGDAGTLETTGRIEDAVDRHIAPAAKRRKNSLLEEDEVHFEKLRLLPGCILDAHAILGSESAVEPVVFFELNEVVQARGQKMYTLLQKHDGLRRTPRVRRKNSNHHPTKQAENAWRTDKKAIEADIVSHLGDTGNSWEEGIDDWAIFCAAQISSRSLRTGCVAFEQQVSELESKYSNFSEIIRFPELPDTKHIGAYNDCNDPEAEEIRNLQSQKLHNCFNFFRDSEPFYRRLLGTALASAADATRVTEGDNGSAAHSTDAQFIPCTLADFGCIKWAGLHIKDDKDLVLNGMRAFLGAGWHLWDCSERLRGDQEICREAYKDNYRAESFFSKQLKDDAFFCKELRNGVSLDREDIP